MEARSVTADTLGGRRAWLTGLVPLLVLGSLIALFVALGAPGLERRGVPVEELAVERTVLRPGEIELRVRNDGPDPVSVAQVIVNDRYVGFEQADRTVGRLGSNSITIPYPWIEGENYEVVMLTSTGVTIAAPIEAATATPRADAGFYGLMALIGLYVGVIPVLVGMLWLPWLRRIDPQWIRFVLALTLGLLVFLGIDALLEGLEVAGRGAQALGGGALVFLGAVASYLVLAGGDAWARARAGRAGGAGASGLRAALLIAVGIGLHNLGEGLAIGSAYAVGALALGATLVIGFALHNTTEGLAIVAPLASGRSRLSRLALLGGIAGAPVIVGAWIGASAYNASLTAFLLGVGAGAIAQVVVQIAPSVRDRAGRLLDPVTAGGLLAGLGVMYATGLLVPA